MGETSVTGIIDPVCDWALDTRSKYEGIALMQVSGWRHYGQWSTVI